MLVLTRKSGESIRIGNDIIVRVLENSSSQVKIGVTAPAELPVHREEIYARIQQENWAAVIRGRVWSAFLKRFNLEGS